MPKPRKSPLKAAQTGHLVLSTLHTNSTSETLIRLQQMGVARWMISSALSLVVAQRLVRKTVSPLPARWRPPYRGAAQSFGHAHCPAGWRLAAHSATTVTTAAPALFELLPVDSALRQAINRDLSAAEIETLAREAGMMTLFESGCEAVERGLTTLEEIIRVLGIQHGD